jgi:hypothetical protein
MTPTDPTGETPPERAGALAITMALGALAASCYASYRRRTHSESEPSSAGPAGHGAQALPQSAPPRPVGNAPATGQPSAEPEDDVDRDGPSP